MHTDSKYSIKVPLLVALAWPSPASAGAQSAGEPAAPAAPAPVAAAPDPAVTRIAGEYRHVGGDKERQALFDAIEAVVSEMNFIARPIARRRLREGNMPSDELHIVITSDTITIGRPGRPTVAAPRDGSTIVWESPDGDKFRVRHRLTAEGKVIQNFVGADNRSENVFTLDAAGATVTVQTTISADRLPETLRFRTTYRRKASAG